MPFTLGDGQEDPEQYSSKRYATRYEPTRRDACLAWWEEPLNSTDRNNLVESGDQEARRHYALLLDISHTGASVALDSVPDEDVGVWLRLEGEEVTEWTEARVVGMTLTSHGPHLVRLVFQTPCTFETLRAAVCG